MDLLKLHVRCEQCGSRSRYLGSDWRMAGDHWEHRCAGVHPQVGHWKVETPDAIDSARDFGDNFPGTAEEIDRSNERMETLIAELKGGGNAD